MSNPTVSKVCSLCGTVERGYTRVFPEATSVSARQGYHSVCSLLGGSFPFQELVLCRSRCWRGVVGLSKELSKVSRLSLTFRLIHFVD